MLKAKSITQTKPILVQTNWLIMNVSIWNCRTVRVVPVGVFTSACTWLSEEGLYNWSYIQARVGQEWDKCVKYSKLDN